MNTKLYENFDVEFDYRGVLTVWFDVPNKPVNLLTQLSMEELSQIISDVQQDPDVRLLVFRSRKESGFVAGADVHAIATAESIEQIGRMITYGQDLYTRIEKLKVPTLAVLHGICLGGGLELALACKYRIALDDASCQLGLPEIKLGFIPGWGGTQRLPKLVGAPDALKLILSGKSLTAEEAARIGLVDVAIKPKYWDVTLAEIVDEILTGGEPKRTDIVRRGLVKTFLDSAIGRKLLYVLTRRRVRSERKKYPAIDATIKAIGASRSALERGLACEREEFLKLILTPVCQHLIGLFLHRERARNTQTWLPEAATASPPQIQSIGIVGGGEMGAGIAHACVTRGYEVVVKELNEVASETADNRIDDLLCKHAQRKKLSDDELSQMKTRLRVTCNDGQLASTDLVIEAVIEDVRVKRKVFASLENVVTSDTILASNTSSLLISDMMHDLKHQYRTGGLHFFNPVSRMELVEVVATAHTSRDTLQRLLSFSKSLGKTPIVVNDSPGFLVNRVLFPYLGEAVLMVEEGESIDALDRAIRAFGMPMGPLELLDQVGIDVAFHVASSLASTLPKLEVATECFERMFRAGKHGKKSGVGFYDYRKGKGIASNSGTFTSHHVSLPQMHPDGLDAIQRRLIYPMLTEAIRCLEENVVHDAWVVDLGMVLGTGFAPYTGGPLQLVDDIGPAVLLHNLGQVKKVWGDRFDAPALLEEVVQGCGKFHNHAEFQAINNS